MAYLIAALDDNHNGQLEIALRLARAAARGSCDAIKVAARTVDRSAPRRELERPYHAYPDLGATVGAVRERLFLSPADHVELKAAVPSLDYVVAPHDEVALGWALDLDPAALYLEPACIGHEPLLELMAGTQLPIYAAVGAATNGDVAALLDALDRCEITLINNLDFDPVRIALTDMKAIEWLSRTSCRVGHRDGEPGWSWALVAAALGASVVEKRLTLDRTYAGVGHARSLLPTELAELAERLREWDTLSSEAVRHRILAESTTSNDARVGIVASRPIEAGERISTEMLDVKPPPRGLSPRLKSWLVGRKARFDIELDEPITFGLVE